MSRLVSHWSRASLVMLVPAILCHKEPALDARAGSLWRKTSGEANPRNSPRHRGGPVHSVVDWRSPCVLPGIDYGKYHRS